MNVRPATKADIPAIRHIAHETWPVAYGKIISNEQLEYMLELIYSPHALEGQFDNGHCFFMAEEEGGQPIGFAGTSATEHAGSWKLHKLYVLPGVQKSGAGKALMSAVVNIARNNGAKVLLLNVNRSNPAYNFYIKNGFTVAETVDIPIGGGFFMNDYVMQKEI